MLEAMSEGVESVPEDGDEYADNPAPRPFDELLGDLVRVCVLAALKRLEHSSQDDYQ